MSHLNVSHDTNVKTDATVAARPNHIIHQQHRLYSIYPRYFSSRSVLIITSRSTWGNEYLFPSPAPHHCADRSTVPAAFASPSQSTAVHLDRHWSTRAHHWYSPGHSDQYPTGPQPRRRHGLPEQGAHGLSATAPPRTTRAGSPALAALLYPNGTGSPALAALLYPNGTGS